MTTLITDAIASAISMPPCPPIIPPTTPNSATMPAREHEDLEVGHDDSFPARRPC
jgi:hypothetical protein